MRQNGLVVRRVQAEQPARLVSRFGGRAGAIPDRIGQSFELHRIGHVPRPRIRRIEHVLVELRLRDGQSLHHGAKAILAVVGQRHAGEPEIAQRVLDQLALLGLQASAFGVEHALIGRA